jgi:hypothetical protein
MDIKKSLCYSCRWGLCVKQTIGLLIEGESESEGGDFSRFLSDEKSEPNIIEHDQIHSSCMWPTQHGEGNAVFTNAVIDECNRYETTPETN